MKPNYYHSIVILILSLVLIGRGLFSSIEKNKETITVYTQQDIYFLEGTRLTTESGNRFWDTGNRQEALEILEQWTADDANEPIRLVTLTEDGACTYEILVPEYLLDKIILDNMYWEENSPYPMDVAATLYDSLQVKYYPLIYDY
jgi:hypothetical protein